MKSTRLSDYFRVQVEIEAMYTLHVHIPWYNYHYRIKAICNCKYVHS